MPSAANFFARSNCRSLFFGAALGVAATLLAPTAQAVEQTYDLAPARQIGETNRVEAQLQVAGNLRIQRRDKIEKLPMTTEATLVYDEQILAVEQVEQVDGRPEPRSVRSYEKAAAKIGVGGRVLRSTLRDDRSTIVVDLAKGRTTLFSPAGTLTRDEFDLLQVVGNSLVVSWLLPERPVKIGETWQQPGPVIGALLGLEAVAECNVQSVLTDVQNGFALVNLAGTVRGAAEGISTEIELKAKYAFDLSERRVTGLTLAMREQRSIGHVSPGLNVTAKLRLKLKPIERSEALASISPEQIATMPETVKLLHQPRSGGFEFSCDPSWFVTADDPGLTVLRMVERGDLVAQCNISPVTPRSSDRPLALNQYQSEVQHTLKKNGAQQISAAQWTDSHGQLVYRVVAQGEVQSLPIEWRYYLVSHPSGRRVALAFTVETGLAERLGESDRSLVDSLILSELPAGDAKSPRTARGNSQR